MEKIKDIETERLIIREFNKEDWKSIHEYGSDPEVVRFLPWGPNTIEDSKKSYERMSFNDKEPRENYELAVVIKEENKHIGGCRLTIRSERNRTADIGYVFNRNYWRRGFATETARALVIFGFEKLDLHRIYAMVDSENLASMKVLEKNGMRREGLLRKDNFVKEHWRDSYMYAILKEEWEHKYKIQKRRIL